jgi:hypothetical protein
MHLNGGLSVRSCGMPPGRPVFTTHAAALQGSCLAQAKFAIDVK